MTKMTRSKKLAEAPTTEYEKIRAKNMMRNNRIFQSLGITALGLMVRNSNRMQQGSAVTDGDSVSAITQQGSRSEYSPEDEAIEEDEVYDIVVEKEDKVSKKARKSVNKMTMKCFEKPSKMAPGKTRVIAPASGGSKRVLPGLNSDEHESARVTRQKTKLSLTDHEESLGQMDGGNPTNVDEGSLHVCADVRSSMHGDERSLMHGGEVSLMQMDERSRAPSTVCTNQPMEVPEFSQQQPDQQQPDQQQQMDIEATPIVDKCRKGKGLEKLTKELGSKIIIQVAEGKKCPDKPAQAAKLASQGGVSARHHLPILPHFKEYKANGHHIDNFIGKVAINFDMDTRSHAVNYACTDILKSVMKNRRHYLKKKHFDNVPVNLVSVKSPEKNVSDEEWQRLVKMWSTPRHKETYQSNKENRSKVKFHQKTGSRPYISHVHALKEARKGEELTAIDLFKECHNGKKTGFSEPVKKAIAEMEITMEQEAPESGQPKSAAAVVAEILKKECPSNTFLQNLALSQPARRRSIDLHLLWMLMYRN